MKKEQLKEIIENIDITFDYDETYCNLRNAVIDYMNDTQDFDLEYLFDDFIDYDLAEEQAKHELEQGGLVRLWYFLGNANLNYDLFRINGYGNLENIDIDDLRCLKDNILDNLAG